MLERALSRLYTLKPAENQLVHLEAVRAAASACKRPLETFLAKIEKFEKHLGTGKSKENRYKGAGRRIQFNVTFDEDVKELRATLASHVLTIITLLMTQVLCVTSVHNMTLMYASCPDALTIEQRFHDHSRGPPSGERRTVEESP